MLCMLLESKVTPGLQPLGLPSLGIAADGHDDEDGEDNDDDVDDDASDSTNGEDEEDDGNFQ